MISEHCVTSRENEAIDSSQTNESNQFEIILQRDYITGWVSNIAQNLIKDMPGESIESAFKAITSDDPKPHSPETLIDFMREFFPNLTPTDNIELTQDVQQKPMPIVDYDATLTTGEASKLLGCQINTVKNRIRKLKLVGYKCADKDEFKLPKWQFFENNVIPGIALVLKELNENGIPALRKLTVQLANYNSKSIIDVLWLKDIKQAVEMAKTLKER